MFESTYGEDHDRRVWTEASKWWKNFKFYPSKDTALFINETAEKRENLIKKTLFKARRHIDTIYLRQKLLAEWYYA